MKLIYTCGLSCTSERNYVANWLFGEVFGLPVTFRKGNPSHGAIELEGSPGRRLQFDDTFFVEAEQDWLGPRTLPASTLKEVSLASLPEARTIIQNDTVPVVYRDVDTKLLFQETQDGAELNLDILGSLFFLISRYEEAVTSSQDSHERFPSASSWMGQNRLLHRAIANEYIEILWASMKRIWPGLVRKPRSFRVLPSHDIDFPSAYWNKTPAQKARLALSRIKYGKPVDAMRVGIEAFRYPKSGWQHDPFDTIDWLMDVSERNGTKSTFFYIPEQTDSKLDFGMPLTHPQIESQWTQISSREHEIGVHPGYNTYNEPERILSSTSKIRQQLQKLGVTQEVLGSRQHYLRWKTPGTANALEGAQLDYDSTLGFADHCGFRSGGCYEYPMFDVIGRRSLKIRQRPLVVMDCTVLEPQYMNFNNTDSAKRFILKLKQECKKYNGDFTILWHNQRLALPRERMLYASILDK